MPSFYYGVQTALAYIFNHFFYNATHYVYVAGEYYPYRRKNPRSSNPHLTYEDIYEPWKDKDEFSKIINQNRINIKNGVLVKRNQGIIDFPLSLQLGRICDEIDVRMFYPIVYRIDVNQIQPKSRLIKSGSGLNGSLEYLIADLSELEINEILFSDYDRCKAINQLLRTEYKYYSENGKYGVGKQQALKMLEGRVNSNAAGKIIQTTAP